MGYREVLTIFDHNSLNQYYKGKSLGIFLKSEELGGGQLKKSQKKSKSISGILGWVLTFFDPKF